MQWFGNITSVSPVHFWPRVKIHLSSHVIRIIKYKIVRKCAKLVSVTRKTQVILSAAKWLRLAWDIIKWAAFVSKESLHWAFLKSYFPCGLNIRFFLVFVFYIRKRIHEFHMCLNSMQLKIISLNKSFTKEPLPIY